MARPQSRGNMGGMVDGGPIPATLRPGSNMGGPMRGGGLGPLGAPPGTASRMQTGTRQGLGTSSRQRTGAAPQPVLGVGAHTHVEVADRPMTTQGLGLKTGSLGPKRQVYDQTYYKLELRKRITDIAKEVTGMNKEINDIAQDNEVYQSLDKRYETLVKSVRELEGDLADNNLARDKMRTDTAPEEVQHMFLVMKQQNDQLRNEVDQIFLEKRSHEEEVQLMHTEMRTIMKAAEERLNELHPDQRHEYEDLHQENSQLGKELTEAREEVEHITSRLNSLEDNLSRDTLKAHSQMLQGVHKEVYERHSIMEEEVRQCSMSVPEQREILLAKVKTDNSEFIVAEKDISNLKLEKERLRSQIKEVITDAQERRDEGTDQQKYEILFARDQEMSQFIASFDDHRSDEEQRLREKQASIVRLLENISVAATLAENVSPDGHFRDMQDELDFKSKQLQNSETTQNRLEGELAKRQGELDKIDSLDAKISQELQQVEEKMQQYERDIEEKYDRVSDLQGEGVAKQRNWQERKVFLEGRLSTLRQQSGFLRLRYETRRQQLADDETALAIEAQEQKIRQFGQTLFALQSFIKQKENESGYYIELQTCLQDANEINRILQDRRPAMSSGAPYF